jgi:glycosyltransferase involved in cell wall biosynthesis
MCTFNGAAWVHQQLQSIVAQSRLPDELVICDDYSRDGTLEILHEFARTAPFPVRVVANPRQLGVALNFSQAIELCTGERIALADQDDWWGAGKLAALEARLEADPALGLVFSDANLVDAALEPLGLRLWDTLYLDPLQRQRLTNGQALRVLARTNVVTGATMMFRACHKPLILPISAAWIHDGWIALLISAVAACGMIDEPLLDYRQHPRQQIGARRTTLLQQARIGFEMDTEYFRLEALRWSDAYLRLSQHASALRHGSDLQLLERKALFSRDRYHMRLDPASRWAAAGHYWQQGYYREMAWGWKSLLQDLAIQP